MPFKRRVNSRRYRQEDNSQPLPSVGQPQRAQIAQLLKLRFSKATKRRVKLLKLDIEANKSKENQFGAWYHLQRETAPTGYLKVTDITPSQT